jgi:asparagine synthase (glutamine-hydrolysing)
LLLARDRFGKKPLFYAEHPDGLLFASEIKSLLEWPGLPREVNLEAIHNYLTFGYCIGVDSAFSGVRKVPPAHYLIASPGRPPRLSRYWQLAPVDPAMARRSREDLAAELIARLDDAIRCRLISDVPLGAFLSGGVDSSGVVARMAGMMEEPVKTFSVGFAIEGYDETEYAETVAQLYRTDHQTFMMDHGLVRELPRLVWHYGEPYADSSALVTFALAREIRKHVTVALTGDGGDEIFLGYSRYQRFRDLLGHVGGGTMPYRQLLEPDQPWRVRDHYVRRIATFRDEHKQAGYGENLVDHLFCTSADCIGLTLEGASGEDAIERAARAEVGFYLPDDLLVKADIATMAVSLEGRSPFLDHELADWAASLPQGVRVFERNGEPEMKALLKHALEPYLPEPLLYRRKQGFSVPVKHWMRHEIREFLCDVLTSVRFRQRGLITAAYVEHMMQRHFSNREDHGTRLWTLLCLELWFRTFIDRRQSGPLDVDVTSPAEEHRFAYAS